jgi:hypothetical protein
MNEKFNSEEDLMAFEMIKHKYNMLKCFADMVIVTHQVGYFFINVMTDEELKEAGFDDSIIKTAREIGYDFKNPRA